MSDPVPDPTGGPAGAQDEAPVRLTAWLRQRASAGAIANAVVFTLLAATAASRAAHGVLSPAGLVAVVVGATFAATTTGWVAGLYEGADAALRGRVAAVRPAGEDRLAGWHPWGVGLRWAGAASLWSAAGAVLLAAVLRDHSAPFPVVAVALLALAAPAAVAVDVAARAAGASAGAALLAGRPVGVPLLRRAWHDLALPVAALQAVVNAGAAWVLFHGEAAEGALTRDRAFADAVVFAALLAALFGALGARWGSVDAAAGRVEPPEGARARRHPIGPQALVYAGLLMVLATSFAGLVVPASPSLLRVALARGVLAGGLTLVACALGAVRGAANTPALALDDTRPDLPAPDGSATRPTLVRRARVARTAATVAMTAAVALAATPLVSPSAGAGELDGRGLVAELDALGVRVEYDIPAPVSSGSAPQVVGSARRSAGSEAANGIAAAPSRLDPVVGGTAANADKEPRSGDEIALPQAECAFPGALSDLEFAFPTDLRAETAGSPTLGWSRARCGAGPAVELHATGTSPDGISGLGPAVSVGGIVADGAAGPVDGVLSATATAKATAVSILDGLIEVDTVVATGGSRTDGQPGQARSEATVDLLGVSAGGVRFDVRDGDLVVDGTTLPIGGRAASAFIDTVTAALAPSGCAVAVLDTPAAYPQGFLFARPQPPLGVAEDGTMAASMAGGLLVQCEIPDAVGEASGFNPQRLQVMLGFVYTGVSAQEDIGGFGLGGVASGTADGGIGGGLAPAAGLGTADVPSVDGAAPAPASAPAAAGGAGTSSGSVGSGPVLERIELLAANFAAGRPWLWFGALAVWLLLTHGGLERMRRLVAEVAA